MTHQQASEAGILAASRTGDRHAFGQLVERYKGLVSAVTYGTTGNFAASEDLAQETFVTAWVNLGRLRNPLQFRAWLCGIARNMGLRWLRHNEQDVLARTARIDNAESVQDPKATPRDAAVRAEEESVVWQALNEIPEGYRIPLILYYREGRSVEAVATALGISEVAVRQRLHRGREFLRQQVAALVEQSLSRSRPGTGFTAGVIAALQCLPTGQAVKVGVPYSFVEWVRTLLRGIAGRLFTPVGLWTGFAGLAVCILVALVYYAPPAAETVTSTSPLEGPIAQSITEPELNEGVAPAINAQPPPTGPSRAAAAMAVPDEESAEKTQVADAIAVHDPQEPILMWRDTRAYAAPKGTLTGQVLTLDDLPVSGAEVEATSSNGSNVTLSNTVRTDSNGWFSMTLPPGEYGVQVHSPQWAGQDSSCSTELVVRPHETCRDQIRVEPALTVSGRVIEEESGRPLVGVVVVTEGGRYTRTDRSGRFFLDGVYRRDNVVSIVDDSWYTTRATYGEGTGVVNVELRARPAGAIRGRVTGSDGAPIRDVPVAVAFSGSLFHVGRYYTKTGATGAYVISGVDVADTHIPLLARLDGYRQADGPACPRFERGARETVVNIPLVSDPSAQYGLPPATFMAATEEPPGEQARVEPVVETGPQSEYWVAGRVVDVERRPLPNVLVVAGMSRAMTNREGCFRLTDIADAQVEVRAFSRGDRAPGGTPAWLGANLDGQIIVVETPECFVAGAILDATTGRPVTRYYVGLSRPINAGPADFIFENEEALVDSTDGAFILTGLQAHPGSYARLTVRAPGYSSAVMPAVQLRSIGDVGPDNLFVALSPEHGATGLTGIVVDKSTGQGIPDALVVVNETDNLDSSSFPFSVWNTTVLKYPRSKRVTTSPDGSFRFPDWSDSLGWIVVEREGYGRQWLRDIPLMSPVRVELEPEAVMTGFLPMTDEGNGEARGVFIHYYEGGTQIWNQWQQLDAQGGFTFSQLSPGWYSVSTMGFARARETRVTLSAAQTYPIQW